MHVRTSLLGILLMTAGMAFAPEASADGVYGDFIIDYTYIAGHHLDGQPGPDSAAMDIDGWNGFGIRRARIGFKRSLTPEVSMDFRLEASQPDWMSSLGYDGKTASTATPFVKDAYVSWAVTPSPAVGDPAKNQPCSTSTTSVSISMDRVGGVWASASGLAAAMRSRIAVQPPCCGMASSRRLATRNRPVRL
ncbi:MAG TPA: hypothetical protein P5266_01615, partial [Candidatus Fermentibacter sp.]|nr:hypothetical protein [Candidatus Fermentibacter sp.]